MSPDRLTGRAGRLILGILITALVVLPAVVPGTGAPHGIDGSLHMLAGALLARAYTVLLARDTPGDRWTVWGRAVLLSVVVGFSVELGQSVIPGRQPSVLDGVAHAMGALGSLGAVAAWVRLQSA